MGSSSTFACLGCFESVFTLAGAVIVLSCASRALFSLAKNIYVYFFAERLGRTIDFKKLGEWAVVTGATDGIGKGYALDLARRGCNIILISRSDEKLRSVAKEIETAHNVRTRTIAVDFGKDETIYDKLKEDLQDLEIGVLINNVGVGFPYPEYFTQIAGGEEAFLNMIRVNCMAQTLMTRIVLPQMVARKQGVIVHLSSAAGGRPYPFLTVYSATKVYNDFFGRAVQQEYADKGIISQVIMPYAVATNMSGMKKSNMIVLDSKKYARSCLNSVGFFGQTNGHPSHVVQNFIVNMLPGCIGDRLIFTALQKFRTDTIAKLKSKGLYKVE